MLSPQRRAETFLAHAMTVREGMTLPFFEDCPEAWKLIVGEGGRALTKHEKMDRWRFFVTVAMVWWGLEDLQATLFPARDEMAETIERMLGDWDAAAPAALGDLRGFLKGRGPYPEGREGDFRRNDIGLWVLDRLFGRPTPPALLNDAVVVGHFARASSMGYWADQS